MNIESIKRAIVCMWLCILPLAGYAVNENSLYTNTVSIGLGEEVVVPVYLNNNVPICNFEFYLTLPKGVQIKKENNEAKVSKGDRATATHSVVCEPRDDGSYYILEYSSENQNFNDDVDKTSSFVIFLTLVADKNAVLGEYSGTLKNQLLNHDNGTLSPDEYKPKDQVMAIEIKSVKAHSISLSQASAELRVGEGLMLTPTVLPDNATDKTVTWKSSDENIATVNNGYVLAKSVGEVTITATTADGSNLSASCEITVINAAGKRGDANNDDKIDVSDITAIASKILGNNPENFNEQNADANADGKIDVSDITMTARFILGK